MTILNELPEDYTYAGELTDEEKEYAAIDGSKYYIHEGAETIDDFYVYQECGTRISDTEVDNTQRQWAYVKWSRDILYGNTEFTATFYDNEQNEVQEEALWYNLADADNILVEWTGMTPNTVRLFYTPAGTETAEQTQLLMTKVPLDGDDKVILSLSELDKTKLHGQFQIELTYGTKKDTIDYNVLYDSNHEPHSNQPENEDQVDVIFSVSKKYLEDKGLVVEEASLLEYTSTNAVTEMLVSKDGVVEQTARKLILEFHENTWEVITEE